MRGRALMITGTSSSAGKSTLVCALGRILSDNGVQVAPFKGQNMALNSMVTRSGHEIARAQYSQALACRVEAEVEMNPVLLKPTSEHSSQVIVMGNPRFESSGVSFQGRKKELRTVVEGALEQLLSRYEFVLLEGAGSPAEINLLDNDLVNLGLARRFNIPSVLIGDIERGGVFASIFGTIGILPTELSELIVGFVVNKFRGQIEILEPGLRELEERSGVQCFGVLPYTKVQIPEEDSLSAQGLHRSSRGTTVNPLLVSVVKLPFLSNLSDFDPLELDDGVRLSLTDSADDLLQSDLVVLPGTKSTVVDLEWLRDVGLDEAITLAISSGKVVLGICGGYQMLGKSISDGVESDRQFSLGLGHLNVRTTFHCEKVLRQVRGFVSNGILQGVAIDGYQIHKGVVDNLGESALFDVTSREGSAAAISTSEGALSQDQIFGTSIHGLFENDRFRERFLLHVAQRSSKSYVSQGRNYREILDMAYDDVAKVAKEALRVDEMLELPKYRYP